ncbi:MAG: DUF2156 domain-containing protein [Clostridia bacterium]|nr:DUF2156 domain-containing protein [Clostridia bacterium]
MHAPTKEDLNNIYKLLGYQLVEDTQYSLTTVVGWFKDRNVLVETTNEYALMSCEFDDIKVFFAPLTATKELFPSVIQKAISYGATRFSGLNEWQSAIIKDMGYSLKYNRNYSEYLYAPDDLIYLKGKKFHSKRNFINGVNYPYEFRPYNPSDREELDKLFYKWNLSRIEGAENLTEKEIKEKIDAEGEQQVIDMVLDDLDAFNLFADVLVTDGKIIGFVAGEILPNGIGAIYFEKGDISYKGVYPLIDNAFCKKHFDGGVVKYINKQEDMGVEGLRKSKLSYNPVKFAERYNAKKI